MSLSLLESIKSLSSEPMIILNNALPALDIEPDESQVLQAVEEPSVRHNAVQDAAGGWVKQSKQPRYKCNDCKKTFDALTNTPLDRLRVKDKLHQYLECMRGNTTLRLATRQCGVSLPTSFLL